MLQGQLEVDELIVRGAHNITALITNGANTAITFNSTNFDVTDETASARVSFYRDGTRAYIEGSLACKAVAQTHTAWMDLASIDCGPTANLDARRMRPYTGRIRWDTATTTGFTSDTTGQAVSNTILCLGGGYLTRAAGTCEAPAAALSGVTGVTDVTSLTAALNVGSCPVMIRLIAVTDGNNYKLQYLPISTISPSATTVHNFAFSISYPVQPLSTAVNDEAY